MDLVALETETPVILGVDTHAEVHVAVPLDGLGMRLGSKTVPTTEAGYAELLAWAEGFGALDRVGVEGSGSFGVGLARFLRCRGIVVAEINRPNRLHRRRSGKSDPADAEAAARAVLADTATGEPKTADGPVGMARVLRLARRSGVKARTLIRPPTSFERCYARPPRGSGPNCAASRGTSWWWWSRPHASGPTSGRTIWGRQPSWR
jgi:hypothetical protein